MTEKTEPKQLNAKDMTDEQLEALAYRQIVLINQSQANLRIIEEELARRKEK